MLLRRPLTFSIIIAIEVLPAARGASREGENMHSGFLCRFSALCFASIAIIIISLCCSDKNNPVTTPSGPKLTLSLDSTLDSAGDIIVNSISSALLTDTGGAVVKVAQTTSGRADFDLLQIEPGDYFVTVNGLSQDRIPTRIIAPTADTIPDIDQYIGRTLNSSSIIINGDTLFKIKTFFRGQGGHPVRKFSDGADVSPPEYAYCIQSFRAMPGNIEFRIDSTAALLIRELPPHHSPHMFNSWILGSANHGLGPGGDPDSTAAQCQRCHPNYEIKPPDWSQISAMNGLCFKCHYGSAGISEGIVDPAQ
jgi:hypothetical protein